jgi:hypothetical protein
VVSVDWRVESLSDPFPQLFSITIENINNADKRFDCCPMLIIDRIIFIPLSTNDVDN